MIELMNELNEHESMIKFFIDESNTIVARITYISKNEEFNEYFFLEMISATYNIIGDNYYKEIMRVMWS